MTEDEELLEIIARDGPTGRTRDRKLLGAILTSTDYMIAGRIFIPTDPEQAEHALITGGEIVLWRCRPMPLADELRMRDTLHALSRQKNMSINEAMVQNIPEAITGMMQPHELRGFLRELPEDQRQEFIERLPAAKRPRKEED